MDPDLSIVIPVFNEAGNLAALHRQICDALGSRGRAFEVVFVDDGSTDGSHQEAARIAAADPRVRAVRLGRNFGQTAALQAGFDLSRGRILVTIDGDLQNDPADVPRLLDELARGFDIVCGWRRRRHGSLLKRRLPSWIANRLLRLLTGVRIHDHGCALKAFRREVLATQSLYSDMHRFVLVLMDLSGASYSEVVVNDRPRAAGRSKYGLGRIWSVLLDLLTLVMLQRFGARPSRWFVLGGLPFFGLALVFVAGISYQYLTSAAAEPFPIVHLGGAVLSAFAWLHFLFLALIGELVVGSAQRRRAK